MLNVSHLNAYYGEAQVLHNVSVSVDRGQVVVMLGPNGHGKSTLLKVISHQRICASENGELI